jgi:hypothetical protein
MADIERVNPGKPIWPQRPHEEAPDKRKPPAQPEDDESEQSGGEEGHEGEDGGTDEDGHIDVFV